MKDLRVFILVAVLIVLGCAMTPVDAPKVISYTYDGDIDPVEFYSWDIVSSWRCQGGHLHILLTNPDKDAEISMAETMNIPGEGDNLRVVAYRYLKGDTLYAFSFNEKTHNYDRWGTVTDKSGGI